jgi:hypothetical protein
MKRLTTIRIDDDIRPVAKREAIKRGITVDEFMNLALRYSFKLKPYDDTNEEVKPSLKLFIDENMRKWLDENLETGRRIYTKYLCDEIRLKSGGLEKSSNKQLFIWLRYYCSKNDLVIIKGENKVGRWMIFQKAEDDRQILAI